MAPVAGVDGHGRSTPASLVSPGFEGFACPGDPVSSCRPHFSTLRSSCPMESAAGSIQKCGQTVENWLGVSMAIASICEHCGSGFSAPDASLGSGVTCPTCGKKTKVHDEAGVREIEEKIRGKQRREQEYSSRLALLRELEEKELHDGNRGAIEDSVRNFQPRMGTRNRRLRLLGHMLMVIAWTIFGVALILAFFAAFDQSIGGFVACTLFALAGVFGFAVVKFLSEASYSLAEIADRQWDIRALLLDLCEEQERQKESENR